MISPSLPECFGFPLHGTAIDDVPGSSGLGAASILASPAFVLRAGSGQQSADSVVDGANARACSCAPLAPVAHGRATLSRILLRVRPSLGIGQAKCSEAVFATNERNGPARERARESRTVALPPPPPRGTLVKPLTHVTVPPLARSSASLATRLTLPRMRRRRRPGCSVAWPLSRSAKHRYAPRTIGSRPGQGERAGAGRRCPAPSAQLAGFKPARSPGRTLTNGAIARAFPPRHCLCTTPRVPGWLFTAIREPSMNASVAVEQTNRHGER
jgi:hypothetical protein